MTKKAIKKYLKEKKKAEIKEEVQKIENNAIAPYNEEIAIQGLERDFPIEVRNPMENSMYEGSQDIDSEHQAQEAVQNQENHSEEESERLHTSNAE